MKVHFYLKKMIFPPSISLRKRILLVLIKLYLHRHAVARCGPWTVIFPSVVSSVEN